MPTKATLEIWLQEEKRKNQEMADKLDQIATRAMQVADEHGWCGIVEETLREVGIKPKRKKITFTCTAQWSVTAYLSESADRESFNSDPEMHLMEAMRSPNGSIAQLYLDDDFEEVEFEFDNSMPVELVDDLQVEVVDA